MKQRQPLSAFEILKQTIENRREKAPYLSVSQTDDGDIVLRNWANNLSFMISRETIDLNSGHEEKIGLFCYYLKRGEGRSIHNTYLYWHCWEAVTDEEKKRCFVDYS